MRVSGDHIRSKKVGSNLPSGDSSYLMQTVTCIRRAASRVHTKVDGAPVSRNENYCRPPSRIYEDRPYRSDFNRHPRPARPSITYRVPLGLLVHAQWLSFPR